MDKLLLRPTEAAELLGIGRSKIYSLLADGELPGVRVGRSIRVPAAALHRWVQLRTQGEERTAPGQARSGRAE
jgi:excisionase family DNA binding protein